MTARVLVYGATGFSGRSAAERLHAAGRDVVLAGRDGESLKTLGEALGRPWRAFALNDQAALERGLAGIDVVLHAAGPFSETAAPMMSTCVKAGVHYLDLAGEWPVFVLAQRLSAEAAASGVMLMPGVGFSIVVSDCLMAHAVEQTPHTVLLRVAGSAPASASRGSLLSAISLTRAGVLVRQDGALADVAAGRLRREFDFGAGRRMSVAVSGPDVVTGEHTTGVSSIETYLEAPLGWRVVYRASALAADIYGERMVRAALRPLGAGWRDDPHRQATNEARGAVVVEATDRWRRVARFGLRTLDGYELTTITSTAIVERVLDGEARPGFHTPAGRFGSGFILSLNCAWPFQPNP